MGGIHHRDLVTLGIVQLAAAEIITLAQHRQVLVAQGPLDATANTDCWSELPRVKWLKVRFSAMAMIADELMPEWKMVANQLGKWS